jgi:hypothetical protein
MKLEDDSFNRKTPLPWSVKPSAMLRYVDSNQYYHMDDLVHARSPIDPKTKSFILRCFRKIYSFIKSTAQSERWNDHM